ncbi:YwpF family protein [Chryseomicrobium palamuruense]|uniref:YwpF family protein n=1 Tax=Chryseomicrobium palamuruense TaxID=682973 RepID=A0ABV8UTK9_9BACL
MKTFKVIEASILSENETKRIPLEDGIIINQENIARSWAIELFTVRDLKSFFDDLVASQELVEARVVISYPENEPAPFEVMAYSVKEVGEGISVLFRGTLKRARRKYAEGLLYELIDEGLEGAALLERFEKDMKERPVLKKDQDKK